MVDPSPDDHHLVKEFQFQLPYKRKIFGEKGRSQCSRRLQVTSLRYETINLAVMWMQRGNTTRKTDDSEIKGKKNSSNAR
ncbi:hypothetical protein TNIN_339341 [Trichonephila inaurata madagascariensis]|uniref:Uncharacterized protein n=1 Tax=Trichonephila inaurata madagascariensis TaxID=2747483 RepID=A0A8X6WRN1_9ARAC|nr:hypothetical protein TNIN_339341 [Trichonephila inaurata madagascariensis]